MTDPRFFHRLGPFSLGDIAKEVGGELQDLATDALMIHDVSALETAGQGDLSVFNDARYLDAFSANHASAVVTTRDFARHAPAGSCLIFTAQPRLAYAQIGHLFYPSPALDPI